MSDIHSTASWLVHNVACSQGRRDAGGEDGERRRLHGRDKERATQEVEREWVVV